MLFSEINQGIVITSRIMKKSLLNQLSGTLKAIKIYDEREFLTKLTFSYTKEALIYLHLNYGYEVSLCQEIIEYMHYLDEDKLYDEPLAAIFNIYLDLKSKNLLTFSPQFLSYIKEQPIYFYGYKVMENNLDRIKQLIAPNRIETIFVPTDNYYVNDIHSFLTLEDEVTHVAHQIASLIDNGIAPNDIFISNITNEYHLTIKRIFKSYNIPLLLDTGEVLYDTIIGVRFIELLQSFDPTEAINKLKDEFKDDRQLVLIINKIVNILNQYVMCNYNYKQLLPFIIEDFKRCNILDLDYDNAIKVIDLDNIKDDDKHYFILSINYDYFPSNIKDESYLNDKLKASISFTTSKQQNEVNHFKCRSILQNIKNVTLCYKLSSLTSNYVPSDLIKELNLMVIAHHDLVLETSYSAKNDALRLSRYHDAYDHSKVSKEFINLHHSIKIPYKEYNQDFKGIDPITLQNYFINHPLKLSYTSMNTYYLCAFRYYLSNILRIDEYESSMSQKIGILFHAVLKKCYDSDFSFTQCYQEELAKLELTAKERFFLANLEAELANNIEYFLNCYEKTALKHLLLEYPISIDYSDTKSQKTFVGNIDKVMYGTIAGQEYAAIIDYKTGSSKLSIKNIKHGLDLQLPVYLYLFKNSNHLKNIKFAGFYYQHIICKDDNLDSNVSHDEQLRLDGFSLANDLVLNAVDPNYQTDSFIKGLRFKNDGSFYSTAPVKSEEEIEEIINIAKEKIDEAFQKIENGNFDINPAKINEVKIGCAFCDFKVICFNTAKNYRLLENEEEENTHVN